MPANSPNKEKSNAIADATVAAPRTTVLSAGDLPADLEKFKAQPDYDADRFADLRVFVTSNNYGNSIAPLVLQAIWVKNVPPENHAYVNQMISQFLSSINWMNCSPDIAFNIDKLHKAAEVFSNGPDQEALIHDSIDSMKDDFIGRDLQRAITLAAYANSRAMSQLHQAFQFPPLTPNQF